MGQKADVTSKKTGGWGNRKSMLDYIKYTVRGNTYSDTFVFVIEYTSSE